MKPGDLIVVNGSSVLWHGLKEIDTGTWLKRGQVGIVVCPAFPDPYVMCLIGETFGWVDKKYLSPADFVAR